MPRLFDSVQMSAPKKNKFDLSHERKFSFNMGDLVPTFVQEIVPGDSFRMNAEVMMRMAPMLAPIMHRVNVRTEYFFVPNRLVWSEWEDFITGGRLGTSSPVMPFMSTGNMEGSGQLEAGKLADFLGLPIVAGAPTNPVNISALPFRAYQLIWDEYYRDQNLSASLDIPTTSGAQTDPQQNVICQLRKRAWEKDYFTSALPFAQRGPEVLMPLSGTGTVTYMPTSILREADGDPVIAGPIGSAGGNPTPLRSQLGTANQDIRVENIDEVNLDASSVTINELRRSIKLQEWLEKNARGGGRYVEQILSHFGVKSSDARLQRPEYLGGGKSPMVVSEVLSTFQDDTGDIPQGNMAGHAISYGSKNGFSRTFEEHGFVIGLISVLPRTAYQNGIDRKFQRFDRFDYYWPEFANIGEQEIKNQEIFYDAVAPSPNDTFGYQSRYAEYKYGCSSVHGAFRDTLAFWHMGRIFQGTPQLNEEFITADPTDRIFTVTETAERLYCHLYNKVDALRPMPYFGTPTL